MDSQAGPDNEESTTELIQEYAIRPLVRGLSFGIAHYVTFVIICPFLLKKFKSN